jgi:hypothetical protein
LKQCAVKTVLVNLTIRRLLQLALAAALAGSATLASADTIAGLPGPFGSAVQGGVGETLVGTGCAVPEGSSNFQNNSNCFFELSSGFSNGSTSQASTGTSSYAQASLGEGFVSVGASGNYFVPFVGYGPANASAVVWDTLVFSGAPADATANIVMTGTVGFEDTASTNAVAFLGTVASPGNVPLSFLMGNGSFAISTEPTYSFQQTFPIFNDQPMLFVVAVSAGAAECGVSCSGDAFITDPFSLDLPSGVTFTSASGEFPSGGTTVPEPSSVMLIATGLLGVLAMFWRRKRLESSPWATEL